MGTGPPTLLAIQHVPWETPHRILDTCDGLRVRTLSPLLGDVLPDHGSLGGALVMGGPMNVDQVELYPDLAAEREWLSEAIRLGLPILGVCLGAQLLARALGAEVRPGRETEIGFAEVEIHDPEDPVVGGLAPASKVLHWHGDVFDLPEGARPLASSALTEHQAFRFGSAWGLLFHAEADAVLVERWLSVPEMLEEAIAALGEEGPAGLSRHAEEREADLIARSEPGFRAFAGLVKDQAGAVKPMRT